MTSLQAAALSHLTHQNIGLTAERYSGMMQRQMANAFQPGANLPMVRAPSETPGASFGGFMVCGQSEGMRNAAFRQ